MGTQSAEREDIADKVHIDGKTCICCGGPILDIETADGSLLKYCSGKCARAAGEFAEYNRQRQGMKSQHRAFCEYCGKEFTQKNTNHRFCSYECMYRTSLAKKSATRKATKTTESLAIREERVGVCKQCGAFFDIHKKIPRKEFCSPECGDRWYQSHSPDNVEEGARKDIAAELALNQVLGIGRSIEEMANMFGVTNHTIIAIGRSREYIESSRHFARLLAANVQGKVLANLIEIANMSIDKDERDCGKKLMVKADVNKFLATRIFETATNMDEGSGSGSKSAPITIIYQLTPDNAPEIEDDFVYVD